MTVGKQYMFCLAFLCFFFSSLHLLFLVSGPCIYPLGVKPTKPVYQDRTKHVKSDHTVKQTEYILQLLWESPRYKTPTSVHFNLTLTKHYLTLLHCAGRVFYDICPWGSKALSESARSQVVYLSIYRTHTGILTQQERTSLTLLYHKYSWCHRQEFVCLLGWLWIFVIIYFL